jgi:hypothetical protein
MSGRQKWSSHLLQQDFYLIFTGHQHPLENDVDLFETAMMVARKYGRLKRFGYIHNHRNSNISPALIARFSNWRIDPRNHSHGTALVLELLRAGGSDRYTVHVSRGYFLAGPSEALIRVENSFHHTH